MLRTSLFLPVLSCVLLSPVPASAAVLRGGEVLSVEAPVDDDLYFGGGQVNLLSSARGDVIGVGGEVTVKGDVSADLTLAAGRIDVSGDVGDDARLAGGDVRISGLIDDDLFVTGGSIEISEGARVDGDVRIAGGEVFVDGTVNGDLDIQGGRVVLRGTLNGDIEVSSNDLTVFADVAGSSRLSATTLTLGSTARFRSDVEYWNDGEPVDFTPYLDGAGAAFTQELAHANWQEDSREPARFITQDFAARLAISILFAAFFIVLVTLLTKTVFVDAAKRIAEHPWKSTMAGFLYFIITPVAVLLLMLTVVGIPVSLFSGVFYGFSIYFAKPITAMVFCHLLELRLKKHWHVLLSVLVSIMLYACLKLMASLPVFGWAVLLLTTFMAYGAIIQSKWEKFRKIL